MIRLLLALASLSLALAARADVETYQIDPVHSSTGFSVRHILSKFTSSFTKTTGTITVDQANMENNAVEATVEIASVSTANADREKHLQSPDFFDAAKFPTATFKSKAWKKTGADTYDVTGDLTIKGVTKEVVLKVTALGFGPGMRPGTMLSGWEATTVIKRTDFGVSYGPKILGEDVTVNISIEAGYKKA
ncbi:MAG: YceI family protein [Opitutae bacterium]|nr:YceI family protein [Opitutae bacterium]